MAPTPVRVPRAPTVMVPSNVPEKALVSVVPAVVSVPDAVVSVAGAVVLVSAATVVVVVVLDPHRQDDGHRTERSTKIRTSILLPLTINPLKTILLRCHTSCSTRRILCVQSIGLPSTDNFLVCSFHSRKPCRLLGRKDRHRYGRHKPGKPSPVDSEHWLFL